VIGAVVLAAGRSSRMGRSKLLLPLGGRAVLAWVVEHLLEAGVDDVVVVTGPYTPDVLPVLGTAPVRLAHNPDAAHGMASSLRVGLLALHPADDAALIALGDQPTVDRHILLPLLERYRRDRPAIVVPVYRGQPGNPVLFDRRVFPELFALSGDVGGRSVVRADPARVAEVAFDEDPPPDLDTPEAYRRLAAAWPEA
jgi:molybdenum cofactor cytidylyltransferase